MPHTDTTVNVLNDFRIYFTAMKKTPRNCVFKTFPIFRISIFEILFILCDLEQQLSMNLEVYMK